MPPPLPGPDRVKKRRHTNYYLINYFILGGLAIAAKTLALVGSPGHIH